MRTERYRFEVFKYVFMNRLEIFSDIPCGDKLERFFRTYISVKRTLLRIQHQKFGCKALVKN